MTDASVEERPAGWSRAVGLAVAAAAVTALAFHLLQRRELVSLEAEVLRQQRQLEQLSDASSSADRFKGRREAVEQLSHLVDALGPPTTARDPLLEELRALLGEESLRLDRIALSPLAIELSGEADLRRTVEQLGRRLENLGLIADYDVRQFVPSGQSTGGVAGRGRFELVGNLAATGERDR